MAIILTVRQQRAKQIIELLREDPRATEELELRGIYKCPECKCALGDDWDYVDFSNKNIIECPQCKTKIYNEEIELVTVFTCANRSCNCY